MTYPAKPGGHQPQEFRPPGSGLAAGLKKVADDLSPKVPVKTDRLVLDDDLLRALGVQGVSARILQAVLDKPGITTDKLMEAAEAHQTTMNPALVLLMDKGYIEIKMVRDENKRGGMVKAHHASKEGLRGAVLAQIATLRGIADRLGSA